jgi:excisionase family DNA binding protein
METLTPDEAARALNVEHVDYIYRLGRTGALRAVKDGSRWRIDAESVRQRAVTVARKRSSKSHVTTQRAEARARAEAMFA